MLKLSLIIPVYNAVDDIKILFTSITKNFDFQSGEVIIADDCSGFETKEYIDRFLKENKEFKLLRNNQNLGFIKTCNRGMREANGDVLVLLNSDTEIPSDFNKKILACFASDPKIGLASPISSDSVTYKISMPKGYDVQKMNCVLNKKHKTEYPLIAAAEGFCFCIRKELLKIQGYFDESYGRGYFEEVDYAYQAITNGWKNVLIDNLYVYHKRNASFGLERESLKQKNENIFLKKWGGFRKNYEYANNLANPVEKIYKKMFPIKYLLNTLSHKEVIVELLGAMGIDCSTKEFRSLKHIPKVLVHLHLYYQDQAGYFLKKLRNIKNECEFMLCVTMCEENQKIKNKILKFSKTAKIKIVKNTGYDVWPFLQILNDENLNEYDFILKLHSKNKRKKDKYNFIKPYYALVFNNNWKNCLVDSLIRSRKAFKNNLEILSTPNIGMIGCKDFIIPASHDNAEKTNASILHEIFGIEKESLKNKRFIAGTMFMAKAALFDKIKAYGLRESDFASEIQTGKDGTLSHALERLFGVIINEQGYKVEGVFCPKAEKIKLLFSIRSFRSYLLKNLKSIIRIKGRILLISHNLEVEGAPISLLTISKILRRKGYHVELISLKDGGLRKEYAKQKIPVRIMNASDSIKSAQSFADYSKKFNLVIANTVVTFNEVQIAKEHRPVVWFIREAADIALYCDSFPGLYHAIASTRSIYCVSEYAKTYIDRDFHQYAKILHNCCEDVYKGKKIDLKDKISFSIVGTLQKRKAFDIAIDAFMDIPAKLQNKYILNIIGCMRPNASAYWKPLLEKTKNNPNIVWHGQVTGEAKNELFKETDVFLVPSLDESSSRVVLESCMMGRPAVISENVGARYMVNDKTGWTVKTGSAESLRKCIENILADPSVLPAMGEAARGKYLQTSTIKIYENNLMCIINSNIRKKIEGHFLRFIKKLFLAENNGIYKEIRFFGLKFTMTNKAKKLQKTIEDSAIQTREMILRKHRSIIECQKAFQEITEKEYRRLCTEISSRLNAYNQSFGNASADRHSLWNKKSYEYVRIKKFWEDLKQLDFKNKYASLVSGLDISSADTVSNILGKMQLIMTSKNDIVEIFTPEEAFNIKNLKSGFFNKIIKLDNDCFAYGKYLLPIKHFEPNIFYYKYCFNTLTPESIKKIKNKNIIDAGAFIGDSAIVFSDFTDRKIFSFEPVSSAYSLLLKTIKMNKVTNAEAVNAALGAKSEERNIFIDGSGSSIKLNYKESSDMEKIKSVTLDDFAEKNDIEIGLIKVDVEGFEQELLKGAEKTIKKQKPVLFLSIYHTADDFFNIKPLIESWDIGYTFRIVKPVDGNIRSETLLIAEL